MPAYGLLGPTEGRGLLPWAWAEERLRASHNYWVSTVSATGRPHAMAVWGVWSLDSFFFSTAAASRKARNLDANSRCVVTTEGAGEAVIVEGVASLVREPTSAERVAADYRVKYGMGYPPESRLYRVQPEVVFGFVEAAAGFTGTATRWRPVDPRRGARQ
jgi:pyridoxine/pyridoxamine 5'-phosphate oxidase